jgi:O-antigen ligase
VNIIINKFIINGEPFLRSNELSGFSANINIVSYSLAIKFPVLIYLALKLKKKLLKILVYLIIISSSVVIIALLSRGAFLAWMISILIFFIISLIKDARIFIKPLIFVFVSITISYLFVGEFIDKAENTVQQRIESIEVDTDDASINQRLSFYAASIKIIKSSPLIGIGIGNWKLVSIKYLNNEMNEYIVAGFAHNDFLQLASEIGLIGLMCYIMIFYLIFFKLINGVIKDRNYLINLTLLVMLVVYFIDSMLNFPISRPISYIAMIFVLVSSMNINNSVRNEK